MLASSVIPLMKKPTSCEYCRNGLLYKPFPSQLSTLASNFQRKKSDSKIFEKGTTLPVAYIANEPYRAYMKGHCQRIQVRRCLLLSAFLGLDKDGVN